MAQKFLVFMQFFGNLTKSYVGANPLPQRVGAPSYRESGSAPVNDNDILEVEEGTERIKDMFQQFSGMFYLS